MDVKFKNFKSAFVKKRFIRSSYSSNKTIDENIQTIHSTKKLKEIEDKTYSMSFEEKLNFDFAFDPVRDQKLVAKDAAKVCKADEVSFLFYKLNF